MMTRGCYGKDGRKRKLWLLMVEGGRRFVEEFVMGEKRVGKRRGREWRGRGK